MATALAAFSEPFTLSSTNGFLYIEPAGDSARRTRLHLKGANWAAGSCWQWFPSGCPFESRRHVMSEVAACHTAVEMIP